MGRFCPNTSDRNALNGNRSPMETLEDRKRRLKLRVRRMGPICTLTPRPTSTISRCLIRLQMEAYEAVSSPFECTFVCFPTVFVNVHIRTSECVSVSFVWMVLFFI